MTTSLKPPLKGHWPVAFALGGTVDDPALVPLNYTFNVLAGDEYRVPISLPDDGAAAAWVEERMDGDRRFRVGPAVGREAVIAVLSITDFADRPVIVLDEGSRLLMDLSPVTRVVSTLEEIRGAAAMVVPGNDPTESAPTPSGAPLSLARDLGYCVYWALGDHATPSRRRRVMTDIGWPERLVIWATTASPSDA